MRTKRTCACVASHVLLVQKKRLKALKPRQEALPASAPTPENQLLEPVNNLVQGLPLRKHKLPKFIQESRAADERPTGLAATLGTNAA